MANDYYKTLGVAADAEDVVIRAAYKALTQHYNLDEWQGDKLEANKRLFEINEAFVVLTDQQKRKLYDFSRANGSDPADSIIIKSELNINQVSKDWDVACQFNPELAELSNDLSTLSIELPHKLKIALLESRRFDECYQVAKKIEREYLQNIFGSNEDVQRFGCELIKEGKNDASIELKDVVRVMGNSLNAAEAICAISKKHQTQRWRDSENKQKLIILESQAALEKSQKEFAEREKRIADAQRDEEHRKQLQAQTERIISWMIVLIFLSFVIYSVLR